MRDRLAKADQVNNDSTKTPDSAVGAPRKLVAATQLSGRRNALLPISVIGGFAGMLVGTMPATLCALIFGWAFSPLYILLPMLIYLGIRLFNGFSGKNGVIMVCVLTVVGFYVTLLSCQAALYIIRYHIPVLSIPLVTISLIGKPYVLQGPVVSSAYTFPFVFTLLGIFLADILMMRKKEQPVVPEPDTEDETA